MGPGKHGKISDVGKNDWFDISFLNRALLSFQENAQSRKKATELSSRSSPLLSGGILTPPQSGEKGIPSQCM